MALAMVLASQPLPTVSACPVRETPSSASRPCGVLIRPVEGIPPIPRALSDAVAAALVKRNIPAFHERQPPESGSRRALNERGTTPQIDWRLYKEDMSGGKIVRIDGRAIGRTEDCVHRSKTAAAIAASSALRSGIAPPTKRYLPFADFGATRTLPPSR